MLSPMGARRRRPLLPPLERERERRVRGGEGWAEWIKTPPHLPLSVLSPSKKKKKKARFLARLV